MHELLKNLKLVAVTFFCVIIVNCGGQNTPPSATTTVAAVPKTGQTICYDASGGVIFCADTGQDGELLKGAAWPSPRFTDNGDQTITDNLTGQMWTLDGYAPGPAGCDPGMSKSWQDALDYVACLNTNNYLGHNDWHLPNVHELESLINIGEADPSAWLNTQGFNNIQPGYYWSSTTVLDGVTTDEAFVVVMNDGHVDYDSKSTSDYTWPVRTGQAGTIGVPKTGQIVCYNDSGSEILCANTGQDGELQKGVAWPSPRFTDNGNQTITDKLTNLIWTKDGNAPGPVACGPGVVKTWQQALDYAACLNTNNYLSYSGWRLPNKREMQSLINYSLDINSSWLNTQGFINVQSGIYWTSNSSESITNYSWLVDMFLGLVFYDGKTQGYYVWPVRSGT